MRRHIRRGLVGVAALAAAATLAVGFSGSGSAAPEAGAASAVPGPLQVFAITDDGQLMANFWSDQPQVLNWVRRPSGLVTDNALIGLDFRVQDGRLYVVGNHGGIYTVTVTGNSVNLTKVSQLTIALKGVKFGVDFNPAADRLRVISDTGQNLRHNLNDHTTVADSALSLPGANPTPVFPPATPATMVTAAGYTNNDLDPATVTTLSDVNTVNDQLVVQSPANTGLLAPTGALGVDAAAGAGFDVFSDLSGGRTVSNTGFAALIPASTGQATFYTVDVLTGAALKVGEFPLQITGIAVQLDS